MFPHRTTRLLLAAATAIVAAACTDASQSRLSPSTPSLYPDRAPVTKKSADRTTGLSSDITVSMLVTDKGGELEIEQTGLKVKVPSHALPPGMESVRISVTALKGDAIAYEFSPTGLQFVRPLEFEQDLGEMAKSKHVSSSSMPLISYFKSISDIEPASGTVKTYEDLGTSFDVDGHTLKADIWHFSGYILAWGAR